MVDGHRDRQIFSRGVLRPSRLPLYWVLVIPFVLLTTGSVALVGYLSNRSGQEAVEKLAYQLLNKSDRQISHELDRYLHSAHIANQRHAAAIAAGVIDVKNLGQLHRYLSLQHRSAPDLATLLFGTPQGDLLVSHRVHPRDYGVTTYLKPDELPFEIAISEGAINRTYSVDAAGNRGRYLETIENIDVHDRPWFRRALETGKPGWTDLYQLGRTDLLTLNAYHPVYNAQRQLQGVFAVNITLDQLGEFLKQLNVGNGGAIVIMERNGLVLADSTAERAYTITNPESSRLSPDRHFTPGKLKFQRRTLATVNHPTIRTIHPYVQQVFPDWQQVRTIHKQYLHTPHGNYFVSLSPYTDPHGLDWLVLIVIPETHFMEGIQDNVQRTFLLSLLALSGAIAVGYGISRYVVHRIARLTQASVALAAGNLSQHLPANSGITEVDQLAQTFNQMATQLKLAFQQIQTKLQDSEDKFAIIFRASPDPIALVSLETAQIIDVNQRGADFLDRAVSDIIGKTTLELDIWENPADRQEFLDILHRTGKVDNLEVQLRDRQQQVKTVLMSAEVRDLQGQITAITVLRDISDRKLVEVRLQQSELKFSTIFRDSPQAAWISSFPAGQCLDINTGFSKILGYAESDFIGKTCVEMNLWDDPNQFQTLYSELSTIGYVSDLEVIWRTKSGDRKTVLLSACVTVLNQQDCVIGTVSDISDRKQAEQALQANEQRLKEAQRVAQVGNWELDIITRTSFWSEQMFHIVGVDPDCPVPPFAEILTNVPVEDQAPLLAAVDQAIAAGIPYEVEHRVRRADGSVRYVVSKGYPVFDDQRRVIRLYGTALDITDRKQLELALQRSQAKTQDILDSANAAIASMRVFPDHTWVIDHTSAGCETLTGYPAKAFIEDQTLWVGCIHPDDWQAVAADMFSHIFAEKQYTYESRFRHQAGHWIWISQSNSSRWDAENNCWVVTAFSIEISDRKASEQSLQRYERIVSTTAEGIILVDCNYCYQIANQTYLDWRQQTSESLIGTHISTMLGQEFFETKSKPFFDRCFAGETVQFHEWFELPSLGRQYLNTTLSPYFDVNHHISGAVVTIQNITELKQIEEALRQSEARFHQLASAVPGVIYTVLEEFNGPTGFQYLSAAFETVYEVPVSTAIANPVSVFEQIHPDDRAGYQAAVGESIATMTPFRYEWRIITPSGKVKWVQANSRPERLPDGDLVWHGVLLDVSDRKATEHALQNALQELDSHFQNSPLAIMQWDQDYHILRWSKQAERLFGWTAEEVNTADWKEFRFVHEEDDPRVQRELVPLLNGTVQSQIIVNRNYTKDGQVRLCQWYSSAVLDDAGQRVSVLSFAEDITDRHQAELALANSEARLRAILSALPDLIILYSADGIYLDVMSPEHSNNVVQDPHPIGKPITELLPPEIAERQIVSIARVLATGQPEIYEHELMIGDRLLFEEVRVVACDETRALVIVRDINDRKMREIERQLAEVALRDSEERFRRAFDDAAIGMALVSLKGQFIKVNQSLCEITGYTETELLHLTSQDITHLEDLPNDQVFSQQVLSGRQRTYQREKRYLHKQGHAVWVLVNVSIVRDQNDQALYFVSQIQDISDRRKLDRIKDEFISIVSHELRTPLTAIRGSLGILATGVLNDDPDTTRQMLTVALNNSERLVRLVNDILDLERLESGKVDLVMQACPVPSLFQQAVESVQALAQTAQIAVQVRNLDATVWVAPDAIVQTLTNLLSNAIKFSPPHSTVWLSAALTYAADPTHPPAPHPTHVCVQVRDQGRGIPADKLDTIFGRFQQVDVSDARQKGGTGLGLAICKSIVQQHGGVIWVDSVVGEGSRFYVTLPLSSEMTF